MSKRALLFGLNQYDPLRDVNPLNGCKNDILLIYEMLKVAGFEIRMALDDAAKKTDFISRIEAEIAGLRSGDYFVYWGSYHGYQVRDRSGDELTDYLDEAICCYDVDPRDPLTDDWLGDMIRKAPEDCQIVIVSDSCHSGTLTRNNNPKAIPKVWFPPLDIRARTGEILVNLSEYYDVTKIKQKEPTLIRHRFGWFGLNEEVKDEEEMKHLFMGGCSSTEYSYDIYIDKVGKYHGAFTYNFAISVLDAWNKKKSITYREANKQVLAKLKGQYDQHPTLEGNKAIKDSIVFDYKPK